MGSRERVIVEVRVAHRRDARGSCRRAQVVHAQRSTWGKHESYVADVVLARRYLHREGNRAKVTRLAAVIWSPSVKRYGDSGRAGKRRVMDHIGDSEKRCQRTLDLQPMGESVRTVAAKTQIHRKGKRICRGDVDRGWTAKPQ